MYTYVHVYLYTVLNVITITIWLYSYKKMWSLTTSYISITMSLYKVCCIVIYGSHYTSFSFHSYWLSNHHAKCCNYRLGKNDCGELILTVLCWKTPRSIPTSVWLWCISLHRYTVYLYTATPIVLHIIVSTLITLFYDIIHECDYWNHHLIPFSPHHHSIIMSIHSSIWYNKDMTQQPREIG